MISIIIVGEDILCKFYNKLLMGLVVLILAFNSQITSAQPLRDWSVTIDSTWGPGPSTAEKLALFDTVWDDIDKNYGGFYNLDINLDSLKNHYRPEIEGGVSKGRFVAIMNHLGLALKDLHTYIINNDVNLGTSFIGEPLMVVGSWGENKHFGAALTPLQDSSLLVIRSVPNQRLGLVPGDIVLGYEGIPWKVLYKQLLEAELPIFRKTNGSTDESMTHILLQSAGLNWHLFDTIDIVKHNTGDTLHLSTSPLALGHPSIRGDEQLPVPGVRKPTFSALDKVSWGIVDGTQIGYIYVGSWNNTNPQLHISEQFRNAIDTLMNVINTDGMIIDFRYNTGGSMAPALEGYSLLFNTNVEDFGAFDLRGDSNDHFDMVPHPNLPHSLFIIHGDPSTFYDKPIAVLIGPNTVSAGDNEALRMTFHPRVRTFGKPTNGAFTLSDFPNIGTEWQYQKATGSAYLNDDHFYLSHTAVMPDEDIWFTSDDVANGWDTVVESAISWIKSNPNSVSEEQNKQVPVGFSLNQNYPNPFNPSTTISYSLPQKAVVSILIYNMLGQKVRTLIDFKDFFAGSYEINWNGKDDFGKQVASGTYIYRMQAGAFSQSKKLTLLR